MKESKFSLPLALQNGCILVLNTNRTLVRFKGQQGSSQGLTSKLINISPKQVAYFISNEGNIGMSKDQWKKLSQFARFNAHCDAIKHDESLRFTVTSMTYQNIGG